MQIISIRQNPEHLEAAIAYFQKRWPSVQPEIYDDCLRHAVTAKDNLPQWYLLMQEDEIIGGAGLVTNDFISRGDLYPWLCALHIEEKHRGNAHAVLLMDRIKEDTKRFGYKHLYLSTEHVGYYEKYGFTYIGDGYHPWGETSRIYEIAV